MIGNGATAQCPVELSHHAIVLQLAGMKQLEQQAKQELRAETKKWLDCSPK